MRVVLISFLCCNTILAISAAPIQTQNSNDQNANYNFNYAVNDPITGDSKSHYEVRVGDEVSGFYTVKEPDGTIRVVRYTASPDKGFNAVVEKVQDENNNFDPNSLISTTKDLEDFSGYNFEEFEGLQESKPQIVVVKEDDSKKGTTQYYKL